MAELSGEHLIEVRVGEGKPPTVRVRPGETMGPMSVGAEGAWRIDAPGVSREHAEIYFDGKELFARSLSAVVPVLLGGRPVPNAWTALDPPCELLLGEARIWFGPSLGAPKQAQEQMEELLEDDDNIATSVAEPPQRPWGADVGALVQRGIEVARSKAPGGDAWPSGSRPPLPPEPQRPPPPFWPAQGAPGQADNVLSDGGPSNARRTDNSAMTRVDQQVPKPAPSAPWGTPPPAEADGRQTFNEVGGFGGTAVLPSSPFPVPSFTASSPAGGIPAPSFTASSPVGGMPAPSFTASSPPGGLPVPTFGPPPSAPPSSITSSLSIPGGLPPLASTTGVRLEQPTSIPGLEWNEPSAKKSAWREMSAPRRMLILISPLLVVAVAIIFMDKELGLTPPPQPKRPVASAKPSAKPSAAPATSAQALPSALPSASPSELPPEASASSAVSSAAPEPSAASTRVPSRVPPPVATDPKTKTLQRKAADAVAQGSYTTAAELYEQLAKENPKQPAYAEAATIMRAKTSRP